MSTPILYVVINYLTFGNLINTIIANLIGGLTFYQVDKVIFKRRKDD